jgi:solute carrier family 27 fatty acid transporter 1/4
LLWKSHQYRKGNITIVDLFDKTVAKYPSKSAILFEKQKWTFAQLQTFTYQVASYFSAKGFKEGDSVVIFLHNCPEYVGLWLGLSRIGVSSALINYNLKSDVLHHTIKVSNAKAIISSRDLSPSLVEIKDVLEHDLGKNLAFFTVDGPFGDLGAADLLDEVHNSASSPLRPRATKSFNGGYY